MKLIVETDQVANEVTDSKTIEVADSKADESDNEPKSE